MPRQDLALFEGEAQYDIGAVLQPPSEGIWGIPREKLEQLTGFGMDVSRNHEEARTLMRSLGLWAGRPVERNLDRWRARKR
jgi:peptide/nickel transport system substrate-binding protein